MTIASDNLTLDVSAAYEPGYELDVNPDHRRTEPDITFAFGHDAGAARAARRALQPLFTTDDEFADHVRLVASELVSNVVLHTVGGGCLEAWADDPVRIEVHDEDPTLPSVDAPTPSVHGGRGLAIVCGVASRWGAKPCGTGKTLWAEFSRPAS